MSTIATIAIIENNIGWPAPSPLGITGDGRVVGIQGNTAYILGNWGFFWDNGNLYLLPSDGPAGASNATEAYGVNDEGVVVGVSYTPTSAAHGQETGAVWTTPSNPDTEPQALPAETGDSNSFATGINDDGLIIGVSTGNSMVTHGVIWTDGSPMDLGSLGGTFTEPYHINNAGQVVGVSQAGLGGANHAFLWQGGKMTDLGALAGGSSFASCINNTGVIVGASTVGDGSSHAVMWQNGQIMDLKALAGASGSTANAINDSGIIVGESQFSNASTATIWADGTIIDLNTLLPANSGWVLQNATVINNAGQVAGTALYSGVFHGASVTNGTVDFELSLPSSITVSAGTAITNFQAGLVFGPVTISDSLAGVTENFSGLELLQAAGDLGAISITDAATPALSLTAPQFATAEAVLKEITTPYLLTVTVAAGTDQTIAGIVGTPVTVSFSGTASEYTVTPSGNGTNFTVTGTGGTDTIGNVTALQFADQTEIVAQLPGSNGAVTSGNITELYAAVLDREPDVAGLSFYQNYLSSNPTTPLMQFAEWFLSASEYASNPAHHYAQTAMGDTQFIEDSYQNLLHRTATSSEINYYLNNVINPALSGLTPDTQAYGNGEFHAHALMLVYFSASPEFLTDVRITAQTPASAQHWLLLL